LKRILLTIVLFILIICNCNIAVAATLQLQALPPSATLSDGSKVACGEAGAAASTGTDPSGIKSPEVHSACGKGGGAAPQKTGSSYSLVSSGPASAVEAYLSEHAGSDEIYQAAVWAANGGFPSEGRDWASSDVVSSAMNLVSAASTAGDFVSAVTGSAGFSMNDNTDYSHMTTTKNEDGTITVGPYNISFPEGSTNIHFNVGPEGESVDGCVQKSGICILYKINGVEKTKGVKIEGDIRSGKDFYITYNPYDNEKEEKDYIPYVQLKITFSYFTGYSGATKNTYQGSRKVRTGQVDISHPHGDDYCNAIRYIYTEQKTQDMVQIVKGSPTWGTAEFESEAKETEKEFDLSLKKFISEVDGKKIDSRVTVKDTGRLYSKIDQNAVYSKIYDAYNITNVDNFIFTIRIYNEGDTAGKATIVQDHLPEGLNYEVIDSSGYSVSYDEENRIITFKDEGKVRDLNPFTGGDLDYIDIKIKCTLDSSVYNDKEKEQKVYDIGIEQYIKELKREGNVVDIDAAIETNKNRNVKIGDEITYTIKVKNNTAETVRLKEIKQSLPKGIEFIYPEDMTQDENGVYIDENNYWKEITNSDGTSEISRILSVDVLGDSEITYNIRCKVTAKSGILKTVTSIVSTAEQDINQSDWKDYAKVKVIEEEQPNDYDLELSQEIIKINNNTVSGKEHYGLSIGDIVTYKITVKNAGTKEVKDISIANYIPDGMRFIPPNTGEYIEEHKDIEEILDKDIDDNVNEAWSINANGNLSWTKIEGMASGTPETIELVCVVDKEGTFKNIADIISFKDENGNNPADIDSIPNNVKYNEYLYEKQEDDDDYSIVSTDSSDTQVDLKIETSNLKINGSEVAENTIINTGDEVTYEIKIINQGSIDAKKVEIKDVLQGLECIEIDGYNLDDVYDKSNKIINIEESIDKGQTKIITIKCIVTEEATTIELVNTSDIVDEAEVEQGKKQIKHTAYIKSSDIYDKTKSDWKAEQKVGILEAEIKNFEVLDDNELDSYIKYLTNTAMIIETSGTDRDTSDWKDTETVVIEGYDPTIIKVIKEWKDEGDKYKKRPSSITVNLKANGEIVDSILLDINNNWQNTFTDLDKDVTYEIEEVSVPGYDETEIRKNNNTYTIINVYEPQSTSTPTITPTSTPTSTPGYKKIKVAKVWEDNNNEAGTRPDKITVKLVGSNGSTKTVELNDSNNWKHTFTGLNKKVTYTVQEIEVKGYNTQITGSESEGFTITNTKAGTPPPPPTVTPTSTVTPPPPTVTPTSTSTPPIPTVTPTSTTTPTPPPGKITTMEIAGNVFEDLPSTKSGETDNRKGVEDIGFSGIKVTLYECDKNGNSTNIATLIQQYEENPNISVDTAEVRTNPTITDEYGNYSFKGLDTTKKYKVEFTYNGLVYEPVEANDTVEYNTGEWSKTSKAVDNADERRALNNKFSNIGSYPNNYEGSKKVYLQQDLENEKIYDGQNIYELIANKTRDFINNKKWYPSDEEINTEIVNAYKGVDSEIDNKLQFIKDSKINAMTTKTYPIYNKFVVDDSTGSIVTDESSLYKINYKPYSEDDVPDFIDEYKSINEELQKIADSINKTIFDGTTYNVDDYFFISDAEGEGALTGYTASVYTTDINKNASGEPKLKVSSDYVVLKNHLAWSMNTHYGIPFSTDPESEYIINCNKIFEVFENNYSEIKNIVEGIVKQAQTFYDNVANVVVSSKTDGINIEGIPNIYPGQKQIHFGLKKREEFDLTIAKDVYKVNLEINNTKMEYYYNDVDIDSYTGDWIAEVRASDTFYERNIYSSDYKYYENLEKESEGKTEEEKEAIMKDKLNIEVTYRIALRNQTEGIIGAITEIVDYFDSEYEHVSGSTFLGDGKGNKLTELRCEGGAEYAGLKTGYIKTADGSDIIIRNGEDKFIYITFKVSDESEGGIISDGQINKDGFKKLITNSSKQNIVEINGYKTYYAKDKILADGTFIDGCDYDSDGNLTEVKGVAGVLDRDSVPGNYEPDKNFDGTKYVADEDDVGVANGIYFLIDYYNQRIIRGTVWEDSAVEELLSQNIRQGNGIYEEGEKLVQNVKVTLMKAVGADVYEDANVGKYYDTEKEEWLDTRIYTNENGEYSLTGFVPGDYEVWFTYDNNSINEKTTDFTYLETRYNGQDYKSTIYNEDLYVDTNDDGTLKTDDNGNKVINNKWYSEEENRMSDAKDIWGDETNPETKPGTRQYVNNYSETLTNDIAESLVPDNLAKYNTEATTMNAKTNVIKMDVEYLKETSYSLSNITNNEPKNDYSKYVIDNIDFGLVERPRAQLSIQKNISNVKVILSDKRTVLFDAVPNAEGKFEGYTNLASIPRNTAIACVENREVIEGTETKIKLKNSTHISRQQGRITMNMDEELMQGAELRVTYEIAVENVGEIDYNAEEFYNKGIELYNDDGTAKFEIVYNADGTINEVETKTKMIGFINNFKESNKDTVVTTKVDQIIDYVENNMKFSNTLDGLNINKNWEAEDITKIVAWDETKGENGAYVDYIENIIEKERIEIEQDNDYTIVRKDVLDALFNKNTLDEDDAYNTIAVLNSNPSDEYDANGNYTGNTVAKLITPGDTAKSDFILTQLISSENENDDLTYKNVLEIVKTSNDVGRRMYFSVAGNHVPVKRDSSGNILETSVRPTGTEIDTDDGELITIIPPFGANKAYNSQIAMFGIAITAIFGIGVYLIKKKVLK